jgi:DNA-binding SARP family transcriptional activator
MARTAERALEYQIEPEYALESIARHRLIPARTAVRIECWPWRYRFRALGTFEIKRGDDGAAAVGANANGDGNRGEPRGMPLRLLRAIVALGARDVREVALIDALWPDADGAAGRRVFDTTLHRLRRQLGNDKVLRLSDGRIGLEERLCWLDTWTLDELAAETARQIELGAAVSVLLELGRRLLDVYRGPLLADEHDANWARASRDRLATKFAHAVDQLGRALEKNGEFQEAAALYGRVLDGDALAERACAGLVRCTAATGHCADAIRLFEQYSARLKATMATVPSREFSELCASLTTGGSRATR